MSVAPPRMIKWRDRYCASIVAGKACGCADAHRDACTPDDNQARCPMARLAEVARSSSRSAAASAGADGGGTDGGCGGASGGGGCDGDGGGAGGRSGGTGGGEGGKDGRGGVDGLAAVLTWSTAVKTKLMSPKPGSRGGAGGGEATVDMTNVARMDIWQSRQTLRTLQRPNLVWHTVSQSVDIVNLRTGVHLVDKTGPDLARQGALRTPQVLRVTFPFFCSFFLGRCPGVHSRL